MVEAPGFEADDVIATLATEAAEREHEVVIVTGDRDSFQLISDPYIRVLYNKRGVSDYSLYDEAGIMERCGVPPSKYVLLASLRGDPSDNLPGIPGVGEKTAAKLLTKYGDLDGVFSHLDEQTPKLRENLTEHQELARSNARVIPLVRDVPLEVSVDQISLGGWDRTTAQETVRPLRDEDGLATHGGAARRRRARVSRPRAARRPRRRWRRSKNRSSRRSSWARSPCRRRRATSPRSWARWEPGGSRWPPAGPVSPGAASWPAWSWWRPRATRRDPACWCRANSWRRVGGQEAQCGARPPVIGHNVKETMRSLLPLGIDLTGLVMDTAVAAYLLDASTGEYELQQLREQTGQLSLDIVEPGEAARDVAEEAAAEAIDVYSMEAGFRTRIKTEDMTTLHDDIETPLVRVLAKMEVAGIGIDRTELQEIADSLAASAATLQDEVQKLAGHEFNVNSTPQLRTVLYEEIGLTPGKKTKTGYSTDAQTLESLRGAHPIIETLLSYREVEKLRSTYGESLLAEVQPDGRIHASFGQTVARTGRLSSDRPNLHNIPVRSEMGEQFRRAFVPAKGMSFLVADYDQVELRCIAHLSEDPGLIDAMTTGADVHRTVAAAVYGIAPEEVTHTQREFSKMVSYGLAYGMEAYGLSQRLNVAVEEAAAIMESYFGAFPRVKQYMDETVVAGQDPRLHPDPVRPHPAAARPQRVELPGAPGGGTPGHERRDSGSGRRHLQDGPGPARPRPRVARAREPARAPGARRGHRRGGGRGGARGPPPHRVRPDRGGRPQGPPDRLGGDGTELGGGQGLRASRRRPESPSDPDPGGRGPG